MSEPSSFGGAVRRLFDLLRLASLVLLVVSALVVGRETYAIGAWLGGLHWTFGAAFAAAVAFALWRFVVLPFRRYWAMPAAARPPAIDRDLSAATADDVAVRAAFLAKVAENLALNPRLAASTGAAHAARDAALLLATRARGGADVAALRAELESFETKTLDPLFAPLDEEANRVLRNEALAVGVGTAVSMNGVLDAWIVLWRNMALVAKIAEIYYGRPGLRGTLYVLRDVAAGVLVAAKAQGLIEGAAGVFGGWFGKAGSALMGPVVDGILNAAVTVRVGYVAKRRCRSYRRWTEENALACVQEAVGEAASQAKHLAADIVKAAGGGILHAAADGVAKAKDFVAGLFRREEPAPAGS